MDNGRYTALYILCTVHFLLKPTYLSVSCLLGSHFHFGESERIIVPRPSVPLDAVSIRHVGSGQVGSVQIGAVTCHVPPSAFERLSTVRSGCIIVAVVGREISTSVTSQTVT